MMKMCTSTLFDWNEYLKYNFENFNLQKVILNKIKRSPDWWRAICPKEELDSKQRNWWCFSRELTLAVIVVKNWWCIPTLNIIEHFLNLIKENTPDNEIRIFGNWSICQHQKMLFGIRYHYYYSIIYCIICQKQIIFLL